MTTQRKTQLPRARLRSRGECTGPSVVQEQAVAGPSGGETWVQHRGYCSPTGEVEVMSDVVVPGFARRMADGEILFNPMSQVRTSVTGSSQGAAVVRVKDDTFKGQTYEILGNQLLYLLGRDTSADTKSPTLPPTRALTESQCGRAIVEACTKAQRPPSDASLLVTIAELDKTRRLVPDLLSNWAALFRKLNSVPMASRRLTTHQVARADAAHKLAAFEKSLTETWLAMRFGVRPLIMDTLGLIKAANRVYSADPIRVTQRGSASVSASSTQTITIDTGVVRSTIVQSNEDSFHVRAMMLWEVAMNQLRASGVSLANIPEAAIDLVTFSFVANWVINVNDFFASLGAIADPGLRDRGGCYVQNRLSTSTWQATDSVSRDPATFAITRKMSGIVTSTLEETGRVVGLEKSGLVVRASPLKFLGDLRLIDAVALLRVQTRGRNFRYLQALSASSKVRI